MSEMINKTMMDSWRKYWGTDDDDIPDPPPAFVRGFNAAVETLADGKGCGFTAMENTFGGL
jgi:hypothetical protein